MIESIMCIARRCAEPQWMVTANLLVMASSMSPQRQERERSREGRLCGVYPNTSELLEPLCIPFGSNLNVADRLAVARWAAQR